MDLPHQVTGQLDDETLRDLERLATHFDCSVEHLVTTAVMRFVSEESRIFPGEFDHLPQYISPDPLVQAWHKAQRKEAEAFDAFIRPAIEAADRGETIAHEDLMAELKELDDEALANKRKNAA